MLNGTPRPDVLTRARELRDSGASLGAIAEVLEVERYPTARGGTWHAQGVLRLLNRPHPNAVSLVPCELCRHLTASKYGICARPECEGEYARRARPNETRVKLRKPRTPRVPRERKPPRPVKPRQPREPRQSRPVRERTPARPVKPCAGCGRLTTSLYGVCAQGSCYNEYRRRERTAKKGKGKGAASVYAVWFPTLRVLKIGFTAHKKDHIFVSVARRKAERRGWDFDGSRCIWKQPGDVRTEAWMQATLSFQWSAAFEQKCDRLCEWFYVPDLTEEEIARVVDSIYEAVPADLVGGVPPEAEAVS